MLHTLGILEKYESFNSCRRSKTQRMAENLCGKESFSEKAFFVIPGTYEDRVIRVLLVTVTQHNALLFAVLSYKHRRVNYLKIHCKQIGH
jgi:hypothetical protein